MTETLQVESVLSWTDLLKQRNDLLRACRSLIAIEGDGGPCGYCRNGEDEGHAQYCPVAMARAAIAAVEKSE